MPGLIVKVQKTSRTIDTLITNLVALYFCLFNPDANQLFFLEHLNQPSQAAQSSQQYEKNC